MAENLKVVFASLLKPVDEPRMYKKLGRSLAQTYKYDVNIIGFKSKNLVPDPLITFIPLFDFPRISPQRFYAPLRYLKKIIQLKPELIVLTSPEFLMVSLSYKIIFGCEIIYDLQENHYRNIIWSHGKPSLLRKMRASIIRMKESVSDRMISRYLLAERCYLTECSFISKPSLILENKALKPPQVLGAKKFRPDSPLRIVYTGTIAASYGIFDSLFLADKIQHIHPRLQYTICGHCPSKETRRRLEQEALSRPWIKLIISAEPIPHSQILDQLQAADFCLIAYRLNPSNENCMPTRIWEALAWHTPMILRKEHPWIELVEHYQAGFAIDFLKPDLSTLEHKLFEQPYYSQALPSSIYWESQEKEWIDMVDNILPIKNK